MSSVVIVFDLGQTCPDDLYRRTVYTVNRNPVIERIVTTASPIDLVTVADVCDVDDFMEERPLFPVTRSRFRLLEVSDESLRLCLENLLSCPCLGLCPGVRVSGAGHSRENGDPGQSSNDTARPHRPFIRIRKTLVEVRSFFDIANSIIAPYCSLAPCGYLPPCALESSGTARHAPTESPTQDPPDAALWMRYKAAARFSRTMPSGKDSCGAGKTASGFLWRGE
jgi:hypothetical protein